MPDETNTPPAAVPVSAQPWMFQPSNEQLVRQINEQWAARTLAEHDAARAKAGTTTLTAICSFTIVGGDHPDSRRVVNMGEEFTVSDFDLPKYAGKGLPTAPKPPAGL